jgi:acetyltransferase-like isoleucine patch superfamily enzyme
MNLELLADVQRLQDAGNPIPWQVIFYAGRASSWLDLGANDGRTHRGCDRSVMTVVEMFEPSVQTLGCLGYREVIHGDMRCEAEVMAAAGRHFERVTATDVIEHIPKADGYRLIEQMERLASREIMIMMPIETPELAASKEFQDFREWGLSQHPDAQRELHDHKSQWDPEDLNALGYQTAVLENFHGYDGFHFSAFVAVKTKRPEDLERIVSQVTDFGQAGATRGDWGHIGKGSGVNDPLFLNGERRIFLGENVTIGHGARLEAITKYNGERFSGQIVVGDGTSAELFLHIGAAERVTIGRDVMIGGHVVILDHDHTWQDPSRPPRYQGLTVKPTTIGDGAWIGEGAFIGKGVTVGEGAVVGAHSVVTHDVPPYWVVAGAPARWVKDRVRDPDLTSIIMPTINRERAMRCVEAVERCTPEHHQVILVDNSVDNLGWVGGVNKGLQQIKADTRYVCLLNDDVEVSEGWLGRMLGTLDRYPDVGVVGPVTDRISGPQQVGESYDPREHWGETIETQRLVGFCLLMRREVVDRVAPDGLLLDPRFGLGNFDDDDLCIRVQMAGWKLRIVRDVWVHHEAFASFRELGIDYAANMEANKRAFLEKWQGQVEAEEAEGVAVG